MKVYIVTFGEYSSYGIEKVFFNKEKARFYQMIKHPLDGYVEEYEISDDVVNDEQRKRPVKVQYNIRLNQIIGIKVCNDEQDMNQIKFESFDPYYIFSLKLGTGRLFNNVMRYGRESKMLLKIAQDRLAQHLYERGTTKEDIIQRAHQMFYDKYGNYPPYFHIRTSMPEIHEVKIPANPVADEVDRRLREMVKNGETLPESIDGLYQHVADELGITIKKVVQEIRIGGEKNDSESDS